MLFICKLEMEICENCICAIIVFQLYDLSMISFWLWLQYFITDLGCALRLLQRSGPASELAKQRIRHRINRIQLNLPFQKAPGQMVKTTVTISVLFFLQTNSIIKQLC